jgi:hypothetical protein
VFDTILGRHKSKIADKEIFVFLGRLKVTVCAAVKILRAVVFDIPSSHQ